MAELIAIVGESGSGKTTSIRNLDLDTTNSLNTLNTSVTTLETN